MKIAVSRNQWFGGSLLLIALVGGIILYLRAQPPSESEVADWVAQSDISQIHRFVQRYQEMSERESQSTAWEASYSALIGFAIDHGSTNVLLSLDSLLAPNKSRALSWWFDYSFANRLLHLDEPRLNEVLSAIPSLADQGLWKAGRWYSHFYERGDIPNTFVDAISDSAITMFTTALVNGDIKETYRQENVAQLLTRYGKTCSPQRTTGEAAIVALMRSCFDRADGRLPVNGDQCECFCNKYSVLRSRYSKIFDNESSISKIVENFIRATSQFRPLPRLAYEKSPSDSEIEDVYRAYTSASDALIQSRRKLAENELMTDPYGTGSTSQESDKHMKLLIDCAQGASAVDRLVKEHAELIRKKDRARPKSEIDAENARIERDNSAQFMALTAPYINELRDHLRRYTP